MPGNMPLRNTSNESESETAHTNVFVKTVYCVFRIESFAIARAAMIRIGNYAFFPFTVILLSFVSFSTFAATGGEVTPRVVFTALGLFVYIRLYFIVFMIICLFALSEASVAVKRIEVKVLCVC